MVSENVVTETGNDLRDYELVLVVSPLVSEESFDATIDKYSRFIAGKGGVVDDTQRWGKRKLAYQIKHFGEGNYVLFKFRMKPAFSRELEANLRIAEEILRHLLVKMEN
ncbi:MAG: 30S ribosomal protein S6 [Chloroflexi bacterium RBG_16_57_8]|nr:MAG: 30S ribosomal protein S6 [Chloroflexi bacterium RBG_16_57_8]